jgi:N-acetylneuraminic acid mutarotase
MLSRKTAAIPLLLAITCLGACGNDDEGTHIPAATYTVGGQLSGLESGASVTLQNNGADDLTLAANGTFTFSTAIADGAAYHVTVLTSPAEHGCAVTNGEGTIHAADVADVAIVCTLTPRGLFSPAPNLGTRRIGHSATLLPDGRILVAGGYGVGAASAELYDPATNSWSPAANLLTPRGYHSATLLDNGKVLVAGGGNDNISGYYTASAELYDPGSNTWSPAGSMAVTHGTHPATLLPNGKVLVMGGQGGGFAIAEIYDPVANTWSPAGTPAAARVAHTATRLGNGKVLVAGGWYGGQLASAELYDPGTNSWSAAASLPAGRHEHTSTLLPTGKVLVAGGWYNLNITDSAVLYDPDTNTWTPAANMATGLVAHTSTVLANGKVLLAGGLAEIYDVDANTWSMTGNPLVSRMYATATLLGNTKVLVVGGSDGAADLATAELYW